MKLVRQVKFNGLIRAIWHKVDEFLIIRYSMTIFRTWFNHFLFFFFTRLYNSFILYVIIVSGEEVISMGYPFCPSGLPTVTRGLVSKSLDCMLQTTCCILNGASGGPLIRRSNGELLGIVVCNVVGRSDIVYPRINFVVPWTAIKEPIMKYLQSYGEFILFL